MTDTPSAPSFERTWMKYSLPFLRRRSESMMIGDLKSSSLSTGASTARSSARKSAPFVATGPRCRADTSSGRNEAPTAPAPSAPAMNRRLFACIARVPSSRWPLTARPIQMFVQKIECPFAVDGVAAVEVLDRGLVTQSQLRVEPPHLGVFVGHPLIPAHAIVMAALHHERPRDHQVGHLRVVERAPHVEVGHLPLDR